MKNPLDLTLKIAEAIRIALPFMPVYQAQKMIDGIKGRDAHFYMRKALELGHSISQMPSLGEVVEQPLAHLHYFYGNSEWFMAEKSTEGSEGQYFGFAILNGDAQMAELGYFSLQEILDVGAELDLHFEAAPLDGIVEHYKKSILQKELF